MHMRPSSRREHVNALRNQSLYNAAAFKKSKIISGLTIVESENIMS